MNLINDSIKTYNMIVSSKMKISKMLLSILNSKSMGKLTKKYLDFNTIRFLKKNADEHYEGKRDYLLELFPTLKDCCFIQGYKENMTGFNSLPPYDRETTLAIQSLVYQYNSRSLKPSFKYYNYANPPKNEDLKGQFISIGGPSTNQLCKRINDFLYLQVFGHSYCYKIPYRIEKRGSWDGPNAILRTYGDRKWNANQNVIVDLDSGKEFYPNWSDDKNILDYLIMYIIPSYKKNSKSIHLISTHGCNSQIGKILSDWTFLNDLYVWWEKNDKPKAYGVLFGIELERGNRPPTDEILYKNKYLVDDFTGMDFLPIINHNVEMFKGIRSTNHFILEENESNVFNLTT